MKGKKLLTFALAFLVLAALIPAIATTAEAAYEEYVPYSNYPESAHPYSNNANDTQYFSWPGAQMLYVSFSTNCKLEGNYDKLYVYNGAGVEIACYSGTELSGLYLTIAGDSFSLRLTSDSSVTYYGYAIDSIYAEMPDGYNPSNPYPQSSHPYASNTDETKSFTLPGASMLKLTFNSYTYVEEYCDFIELYDGSYNLVATYTGYEAANQTVIITGDTFYVRLISDYSVEEYGYAFSSITEASFRNGWTQVGDAWYHVSNGVLSTGWKQISGKWYFFNSNGKMATGWVQLGGKTYFLRSTGVMATGWVQINGSWYFFDGNGVMYANQWFQSGSSWYYLKADGAMATGICKIGNIYYKFNGSGVWIPGGADGWGNDNGTWFYVSGGKAVTGWKQIGSSWYYFTADGEMLTGWQNIGGQEYYLKSSGAMATGWASYDGEYYYFDANGQQKFGWLQQGGKWYYLDPEYGYMYTGWWVIGGNEYLFTSSGAMATGWAYFDGDYYYFDANGCQKFGWLQQGGKWYFLDRDYGYMITDWYWDDLSAHWYHFASDGHMHTGWWQDSWGYWYYFNSSGQQLLGWQTIGGKTYFFSYEDEDGGAMVTNCWVYDTSYSPTRWSFCGSDGVMVTSQWKRIDGNDYYFDSQGWCTNYYDYHYYYYAPAADKSQSASPIN